MLSREEILSRKVGRKTVTLPDGGEVSIRALSRDEVYQAEEQKTRADRDNYIVSKALLDPKLSPEDVGTWGAEGAAGDITVILEAVAELSGLKKGADKSSV